VVGSTSVVGDAGTWLFYIIVAALLSILVLSVVVIVLWKRVDSGRHDCAIVRLLSPVFAFQRAGDHRKLSLPTHDFFGQPESTSHTARRSVEPLFHDCAISRLLYSIPRRLTRPKYQHATPRRRATNPSTTPLHDHSRLF